MASEDQKMFAYVSRPSARDRSSNCTHSRLTRLFEGSDHEKCSICQRTPIFGWLYRCTQDSGGFLPASDFADARDHQQVEFDAQLYMLSPSIMQAAHEGHYTDQELNILWKQKIGVRKTIQQLRPTTSSTASSVSSSEYSLPASPTSSALRSSVCDTETETEASQLSELTSLCRGALEPIPEVHDELEKEEQMLRLVMPSLPPPCQLKVCHSCRPVYRERAWLSLNQVVTSTCEYPPEHEINNRRVSDVRIVKNLGFCSKNSQHSAEDTGRDGRTNFQATVQRLLRDHDIEPDEPKVQPLKLRHSETCYDLTTLTSANSDNLPLPTSHPSGQASLQERRRLDDHGSTDTNNTTRRRRGVEQQCVLPPAQQPNTSSESYEGPPANDSSSTSSGGLTLKIDTHEANAAYKDNTPLQKTPTESLKDSLKRFGMMGKLAARFPID
ncbi:hypothetical protein LTR05_005206 [Lithohypha guttulata]|uniref:Uncharacterized protein n=1 Tax=Lithohypha guttulata TaxID=1690604 RepID=A0AAN7SZW6_9EURO|nr:hypothetical protein LTR05_005206 [Lithohypha guttulata]